MTDKLDDAALAAIKATHDQCEIALEKCPYPPDADLGLAHEHRATLLAEVERLRADAAALRDELTNIASADWRKWHEEVRSADDFVTWAQSRARAAIARARGGS